MEIYSNRTVLAAFPSLPHQVPKSGLSLVAVPPAGRPARGLQVPDLPPRASYEAELAHVYDTPLYNFNHLYDLPVKD